MRPSAHLEEHLHIYNERENQTEPLTNHTSTTSEGIPNRSTTSSYDILEKNTLHYSFKQKEMEAPYNSPNSIPPNPPIIPGPPIDTPPTPPNPPIPNPGPCIPRLFARRNCRT